MAARPLIARQPNRRLEALMVEAKFSNSGLASRVNTCGLKYGLNLRYDKSSVSRWLRGQRPRRQTAAIIAEVMGERLGRTVLLEEIGMAENRGPSYGLGLHFQQDLADAVDEACELWRSDADFRDHTLAAAPVSASALIGPSRDWLISSTDASVSSGGGWRRVGTSDVVAVRATTRALAELDHRFGGGHVRSVVVHYLNTVVSGLLTSSYSETTGRELYGAAARLTELAGYLAVDTGRPNLALRCYVQALRLAQAAGDRGFGGYVLAAGMSLVAPLLGFVREAVQLARAAREGTHGRVTPGLRAVFYTAEAKGHALLGDPGAFSSAAEKAAESVSQTRSGEEPEWTAHFDRAYLADAMAHCHRILEQPEHSARWAQEGLAALPATRVRRRVIDLLLLAEARAQGRDVAEACRVAHQALDLLDGLRSRLALTCLDDLCNLLGAFDQDTAVRAVMERLAERNPSFVVG